jgi:hypothetical protein
MHFCAAKQNRHLRGCARSAVTTSYRAKARGEPRRCSRVVLAIGFRSREIIMVCVMRRKIGTAIAAFLLLSGSSLISFAQTGGSSSAGDAREADIPFRSIVPNSWTLLPPEPQSSGRRFVSPTGDAWLWFFAVPANREAAVNANAEQLASPPAERVTYERQGSDWVVSSGYRGDRIFYRRAMLACNGTKWRHIEFEYPASEKRHFDNFVTRTSFALRAYQDVGCGH